MNQTQKHTTGKKLLALLLALIMSVSLLPMSVFAADLGTEAPIVEGQTQQDVQQDESSGEEENVDSQEPVEDVQEPTEDVDATDDIATQEGDVAVQAAATINYVEKIGEGKKLDDSTFYRIVHIDCGRRYFTVDELKQIIDYAYKYGYTHVELAFGNDGLRFLLDDMSLTVNDTPYTSDKVTTAIKNGNTAGYLNGSTGALSESEMGTVISYAKGLGIGIIPMMDAPGHMNAVISAMSELGVTDGKPYFICTNKGEAFNPTDTKAIAFVQALMQKYITYFKGQGCTMFNIAADECGFSNMDADTYTAYAKLVNSMAAMVQNAGMTALAFNDGIYHKNLTTSVAFDTNIAICYWDASTDKYASAATLANDKGFKIINTHNKWYYVPGTVDTAWYGYTWSANYMNGDAKDCTVADGKYTTNVGCMNAIWFDNPDVTLTTDIWGKIEKHIALLSTNNSTYFTKVTPQPEVTIKADKTTLKVGDTVTLTLSSGVEASWSVDKADVIELISTNDITGATSVTATAVGAGTATVTATVDGTEYTQDITVTDTGDVEVTEERTITLTIGQISEKYTQDGHYGNVTDGELKNDAGVVVATYTSKNETGSGVSFTPVTSVSADSSYYIKTTNGYLTATGSTTDDVSQAAAWTWKFNSTSGSYTYGRFQINSSYLCYSNGSFTTVSTTTSTYNTWVRFSNGQFLIYTGSSYSYELTPGTRTEEPAGDITTITFKGVAEGKTTVIIGHVKYTINVTKENLSGVDPLPIQTWITNYAIETGSKTSENYWAASWSAGTNNQYACYVNIAAADVYGPEGKLISECMPNNLTRYEFGGTYWEEAKDNKAAKELVVWSGRVHSSSNVQKIYGKDYSNTGTEFNYVRYYGGKWEVSATGLADSWVEVKGTNTQSTEQIAVYYMMRSEITTEVTTDVADWGYIKSDDNYSTQITAKQYVILDFAVKYEEGTRNPDTFPQDGKTFVFHCTPDDASGSVKKDTSGNYYRQLNNFRGVNTSDYEIYMVTVTMTNDSVSKTIDDTTDYSYEGKEQIVWAIDEKTRDDSDFEEYQAISSGDTTYSGCKIGGDPYVRGVEVYNQHGALITYYIRSRAVEGQLTVHYIDKASNYEFYKYNITIKDIDDMNQRFKDTIKLNPDNWKGDLLDGDVVNNKNVTLTVSSDLSTMPGVPAGYRYAISYTCEEVTHNTERTDVYLYYVFVSGKTFVVDFGLPLKITPKDFSNELENATLEKVSVSDSAYAAITTDKELNVIYTLYKTIDGEDNITVGYSGQITVETEEGPKVQTGYVSYTVTIIPASTVYYEDNFAKFYGSDGAEQKSFEQTGTGVTEDMGVWYADGAEKNSTPDQALEELGKKDNVYGYDPAYTRDNNSTTFSMGSAKKVTVDAKLTTNPTAQFTFKGTGFDVISLTDNRSGAITVTVTSADGSYSKDYFVDNYYGYSYENGKWVVNKNAEGLYQIPVMKVENLPYGEYTATITVFYNSFFNHTDGDAYSFWLDAIRVYNPMGVDRSEYTQGEEKEGYPQYIKLRNALADKDAVIAGKGKVVFIDGGNTGDIATYANYGPNNEVYLMNGQAISFKVPENANIASIQIGAKAPRDNTTAKLSVDKATLKNKATTVDISTATEMYYELFGAQNKVVTIANDGGGILSLTNLKITFTNNTTISLAELTTLEQTEAVAAVRALFAAPVEPEPDPEPVTFEPERFEVSWNRSTVKVGQKATLTVKTSEDVDAITVDGETFTNYRTRTQREGWGWNAKKVTYREFTYTVTAAEAGTLDVSVAAVNAEGVSSAAVTATVTVQAASQRPGIGGWLENIFGRWF